MKKLPPAKPLLCCILNQSIMCKYCGTKFCKTCGSPFGASKHFLVGQCRKRYKPEHIKEAGECEKRRIKANVPYPNSFKDHSHIQKCRPCKSFSKGRTDRITITFYNFK